MPTSYKFRHIHVYSVYTALDIGRSACLLVIVDKFTLHNCLESR